jgi:hypothetical protein
MNNIGGGKENKMRSTTTTVMIAIVVVAATMMMMLTPIAAVLAQQQQQQPPTLQLQDVYSVHFNEDGTGTMNFAWPNGTQYSSYYSYEPLEFRHILSVDSGYKYTQLPKDCLEMFYPAVLIGKVYYPNGTRLDPNTMNLSEIITGIIKIPTEFKMPDEIKITNDTDVSWAVTGKILRPAEDAYYNDYCGLGEGGRNDQEEIDVLNRLK